MLKIIATPIGNPGDITLRAIEALKAADLVIGEERREVSTLLKRIGVEKQEIQLLNEHTTDADVNELLKLCAEKNVALVSDCGTPGFCDPGARLVEACRKANVQVTTLPGASSLMCLLSLSGTQIRDFVFAGFPPAEREERAQALRKHAADSRAVVLMDTPYRLGKLLSELSQLAGDRRALLGMDFTLETETIVEDTLKEMVGKIGDRKAEFMLLLYPEAQKRTIVRPTSGPVVGPARHQERRMRNGRRFTPGRRKK